MNKFIDAFLYFNNKKESVDMAKEWFKSPDWSDLKMHLNWSLIKTDLDALLNLWF